MSGLPDLTNIGPEARIRIEAHKAEEMQCSFIMKILMIIEIAKPFLKHARLWKTHELSILSTRHSIPSLPESKKFDLKSLGPGEHRHFSLYPFLWAIRPIGRAYL